VNTTVDPGQDDSHAGREQWLRAGLAAPWWEIAAVVAVVIGPFAGRSIWMAFHGSSAHYINLLLTDSRLLNGMAVESGIFAALLWFLYRRGWRTGDFKIRPGVSSTLEGIPLFLAVVAGNFMIVTMLLMVLFLLQLVYPWLHDFFLSNIPHPQPHSVHVGWIVLIAAMILNAFFEEMTCMGYVFNQFAVKRGPVFALILTVALRMACHTYQGPIHMLGIGVVFTIFGLWYWYARNLWPLIAAHAFLDIFSTGMMKIFFS